MIARVAESCCWMFRYVERLESTARLLEVHRTSFPEVARAGSWRAVLVVAGEEPAFLERFGPEQAEDGERVLDYLTWDEKSPAAIRTCLRWARENARTTREVISDGMWTTLNDLWLWINGPGRDLYQRDPGSFYEWIIEACQLFHGVSHNTMLHEEPFDFMRLGMLLERAGQTARVLDVHHHVLGQGPNSALEDTREAAQWLSILRSCLAREAYFKKRRQLSGRDVTEFLLLEKSFPHSVQHCISRAWNFISRVRGRGDGAIGSRSALLLRQLRDHMQAATMDQVLLSGLHEELTYMVECTSEVCAAIQAEYFEMTDAQIPEVAGISDNRGL